MESIVKRNTFSIMLFINRGKQNKHGEHPIYCRVTVQGKPREFSTQTWVANNKWNVTSSKVIGSNEAAKKANHVLNSIKTNLSNVRGDLLEQGKLITAEIVINLHLGKGEEKHTLLQIHEYHNEQHVKKLIGKDYAPGTYGRYKSSLDHIKAFLKKRYSVDDILLNNLSHSFATDYEFYLKTKNPACAHNTAVKYVKNLMAVINYAVSKEWLKFNPLGRYKAKLDRVDKEYLSQDELDNIAYKKLSNDRIAEVRDVFVFCCYTGLAYSDVSKLSQDNIVSGINGKLQINLKRTKTNTIVQVQLLEPAIEILERYKNHPVCLYSGKLLPVKSNQKQNAYLKEIAEICNCNKNLTTHIARHTFATYMLTLGTPIESISFMLGHTDIKTTQIYGKITGQKVTKEMDAVSEKLKSHLKKYQIDELDSSTA